MNNDFLKVVKDKAKANKKTIVLPESNDDRVLKAASIVLKEDLANIVLLGEKDDVLSRAKELNIDLSDARIESINNPEKIDKYAKTYAELYAHKGKTYEDALKIVNDVSYYGAFMVRFGEVDGMVSGAIHSTADTLRPAFQVVKTAEGIKTISGAFFMILDDATLIYADCAVVPNPTPEQKRDIAITSAKTAKQFGLDPKVAVLSYSTGDSGKGQDVDEAKEVKRLIDEYLENDPETKFEVEGPIQYDAAVDENVAKIKLPDSKVAGKANVFIFPNLSTGNITYKAVQRSTGSLAVGPILQGIRKPINDLSRGAEIEDIANTILFTCVQAEQ